MRRLALALAALAPLAGLPAAAGAEPAQEAASATGACLAAVIDKAPVASLRIGDVEVRRQTTPNVCTVIVSAGVPRDVRTAVMAAISQRPERFAPARTRWAPGAMESREALCNAGAVKRDLMVMVDTARPDGQPPILVASVMESPSRDARCDRDLGLQQAPATGKADQGK